MWKSHIESLLPIYSHNIDWVNWKAVYIGVFCILETPTWECWDSYGLGGAQIISIHCKIAAEALNLIMVPACFDFSLD